MEGSRWSRSLIKVEVSLPGRWSSCSFNGGSSGTHDGIQVARRPAQPFLLYFLKVFSALCHPMGKPAKYRFTMRFCLLVAAICRRTGLERVEKGHIWLNQILLCTCPWEKGGFILFVCVFQLEQKQRKTYFGKFEGNLKMSFQVIGEWAQYLGLSCAFMYPKSLVTE